MLRIVLLFKPVYEQKSIEWNYMKNDFKYKRKSWNEADLHALQWAHNYKKENKAHITLLTAVKSGIKIDLSKLSRFDVDHCIVAEHSLDGDPVSTSEILSSVLKEQKFDLVLAGSSSEDANNGVVPIMVAASLNLPVLTQVHAMNILEHNSIQASRKESRDSVAVFDIPVPSVISVTGQIAKIRYMPKRKKMLEPVNMVVNKSSNRKKMAVEKIGPPNPNIWHANVPEDELPQHRLLQIMGLATKNANAKEKRTEHISNEHIHFVSERLISWMRE